VEHLREGLDLHVRETGIHATFAIRSHEQAAVLLEAATANGFDVTADTS
jgi:threonine dehydratase